MRLPILSGVYLSLATMMLFAQDAEFSRSRELPPLKLTATGLDTILLKAQSLIAAANGTSSQQQFVRERVKVGVSGKEIEIPHFSLASSVAFPREVFEFSYSYYQADKPISSVTIDLGDSSRLVSLTGESAEKVETLANLLENNLRRHSTAIGGAKFRRLVGVLLLVTFLMSLMVSGAYCWNTRRYGALGMPICSALGLMLVLFLPWQKFLPGFVLYQSYSPFFLVRHASEVAVVALAATIAGIPFSYFLARNRTKDGKKQMD